MKGKIYHAPGSNLRTHGLPPYLPHVIARVDLLHLDLGVDVAVGQEVDVGVLHFGDCVLNEAK